MTPVIVERDGVRLVGYADDAGAGVPVLFQHGLGGALDQVEETVVPRPGFRRLTLECRAQGVSPAGPGRPFSLAMFADDVLALADAAQATTFVSGGISMGAAIALRLAVLYPHRVRALLLVRPAWLFDAAPPNMRHYAEVAAALRAALPAAARAAFARSEMAAMLARNAPANLDSLLRWFDRDDPSVMADLLADIAADGPGVTRAQVEALRVPTLVVGNARDVAHPLSTAQTLAATIPGARLVEVPPKLPASKADHLSAIEAAVTDFLDQLEEAKPT